MTARSSTHVCHYRSRVDDADQPYVVTAPDAAPLSTPPACVVWLHDTLAPATRDQFVEQALAVSHRWRGALEQASTPTILLQPLGRGNAAWLGPGGRDLFDVLEVASAEYGVDPDRVHLVGVGSGGTGALQLAAWFPDLWRSVAACAAAVDDRLGISARSDAAWESQARESVRTISLARNLAQIPLYLEHPWWADGLEGTAHVDHFDAMVRELKRVEARFEAVRDRPLTTRSEAWPRSPSDLLKWMLSRPSPSRNSWQHASFTPRSRRRGMRIDRVGPEPGPSVVRIDERQDEFRVRTAGVLDLALQVHKPLGVKLDRDQFTASAVLDAKDPSGWVRFHRLASSWSVEPPLNGAAAPQRVKTAALPGPVLDMRWDGVAFVPGTLGDDAENRTMARLAETMRSSWIRGDDSPSLHPADATTLVDYKITPDAAVADEWASRRHLVVIGTPRTNLLLAKYRAALGCQWPEAAEAGASVEPFRVAGRLYNGPRDGLFLLGPNPDFPDRYLFLVTATTVEALAKASLYRTAYMPDYLTYRDAEVRTWGRCASDWRP